METQNISQLVLEKSRQFGERTALCLAGTGTDEQYTYRQLAERSGSLAAALIRHQIRPDDRVALLCESRPRWGVVFFATLRAGAVLVPLDSRMEVEELAGILNRVRPRLLLVSREQEIVVRQLQSEIDTEIPVMSLETDHRETGYPPVEEGSDQPQEYSHVSRSQSDAAIISFTSGTTGSSKGVITTHGNLLFQIQCFQQVMGNDENCICYSILPLSHLFELTVGFLGVLAGGGKIVYGNSLLPEAIVAAIREHGVTCMVTVPLFLKLLYLAIQKELLRRPWPVRALFSVLIRVSAILPVPVRRRIFSPIHRILGDSLDYFVAGGAPLDHATLNFFNRIGLPVFQGYGMAEASPVITTNSPAANRPGSVGRPLPGVEVRISGDIHGEILTRGPHVMRGYFDDRKTTSDLIDDSGWLHTGDMGYVDSEGYLYITGRRKNIIVLGNGKKVQPEEVEEILFAHPYLQEGCIVGKISEQGLNRGSEEVCAIAVASEEAIRHCESESLDLNSLICSVIRKQARRLSNFKQPTTVVLSNQPLPRTASKKIRRQNLHEWLNNKAVLL